MKVMLKKKLKLILTFYIKFLNKTNITNKVRNNSFAKYGLKMMNTTKKKQPTF